MAAPKPLLVAFGIPTVDFSFLVSDKSVIDKHNLNLDGQHEKTAAFLDLLKNEFHDQQYEFKKLTGGNSQISSMIFQSLIKKPYQTVMCGAIGDDDEGLQLDKNLSNKFVKTSLDVLENKQTAASVIIVHKSSRTIAATNGAGEEYSLERCKNISVNLRLIQSSSIVLLEGFFIGFSSDIVSAVIESCNRSGITLAMNISGSYVAQRFANQLLCCLKYSNVVIGNRGEFDLFCESIGLRSDSFVDRLNAVHKLMNDDGVTRHRPHGVDRWKKILIVTDNKDPIHCLYGDDTLVTYAVPCLSNSQIVDTCGAGDSFLGGFLYGLVRQYSIERCLEIGCAISSSIIRCHGYEIDQNTLKRYAAA